MIDTIFYFAPTKVEYESYQTGHEIDPRTVVFVAETGEIYKNGKLYGKMSESDFREMLEKIMQENPYVLPKATKYTGTQSDHIGGVMGGKYISVNTTNGVISVDAYELFNDPSVQQLVKNIIDAQYIKEGFTTKASYDQFGITKIKKKGGILVNGGIIQIDPDINNWDPEVINGLKGQDGVAPTISIGTDGYWYINGLNTGVKAKGDKGDKGDTGAAGSGISSIKYLVDIQSWYLLSNTNSGITTSSPGWTLSNLTPTSENRYLWRKDVYKYSDGTEVVKGPYLVGSIGEKGDRGETGPGGGFDPETDTYIQEINTKVVYNYNFIQELLRGEITRIDQLVNTIDTEIKERVTDMITDAQWILENFPENVIDHTDGWSEEMKAYLQRVGLWWEDSNGNVTTRWSDILQRFDSIEANVNTLVLDPEGKLTSLLAALSLFTDDTTARATLDTFWAKTNEMKDVITWMYSGLRNEASENATWSDLISAAKGEDGGTAASNLHTGIERTLEGKFIAKGSLITELDGELREKIASGVLTQTDPNYSFASLFSDVLTNNRNFADLSGQVSTIVDMTDPLNAYVQLHMIAEATIYAVEMETKTVMVDGVAKQVDVPVYYSDPSGMGRYKDEDKSKNIYLKYIQDKNDLDQLLWVITDEEYVYDGTTYKRGDVVTFNPESHGEFKKIVKNQTAAGFVTYADFNSSAAIMNARYDDVTASVSASVKKDENDVVVGNIVLNADNVSVKNGSTTTALFLNGKIIADYIDTRYAEAGRLVVGTPAEYGVEPTYNNVGLVAQQISGYAGFSVGKITTNSLGRSLIEDSNSEVLMASVVGGGAYHGNGGRIRVSKLYGEPGGERHCIVSGGGITFWPQRDISSDQPNAIYGYDTIRIYDTTDRNIYTQIGAGTITLHGPNGETKTITYAS